MRENISLIILLLLAPIFTIVSLPNLTNAPSIADQAVTSGITSQTTTTLNTRLFYGYVWSGSANQGLAGATVTVSGTMASGSGFTQSVVTGSDGRWEVQLPWGSYTITFSAPGYQSQSWQNFDWNPNIIYSGGTLTLQPLTTVTSAITSQTTSSVTSGITSQTTTTLTSRLFYGFVWSASLNQPIPGATVAASSPGYSQVTYTGSDGMWNIVLPWGSYTITVSASGYQSQTLQIDWEPGQAYSGGSITLQPLATTTITSAITSQTITSSVTSGITSQTTTLTSRLFYGFVWSASLNQPIPGATVAASSSGYSQVTYTGSDGMWNIVLPWGSYTITVSASGYQSQTLQIDWEPGQSYSGGSVTLQPLSTTTVTSGITSQTITSSVTSGITSQTTTWTSRLFYGYVWSGSANQGLAGATVTVSGTMASGSGFTQSVVTGSDGRWEIQLPWGSYTVAVSAAGYQSQSFQLGSWSPDTAYSGGVVHLQPLSTTTITSAITSQTTTWVTSGITSQTTSSITSEITSQSTTWTSRLFYGSVWSGSTNQPLAGATVAASGSGFMQSVVTGSDGRWEIQLPWGSYTITFSAPGYQSSSIQIAWSPDVTYSGGTITLQPTATWTFMVYVDGDNNLEQAMQSDLEQMEMVGSSTMVNVVVLFDRKSTNDAMVYYVEKGDVSAKVDWGPTDMGDPGTLKKFIAYSASNYPAHHYALILYDHGGGYQGVVWDDHSGNHLTMSGLKNALSGLHFDVVGFHACLMSMVEVAFQIRGYSDYMVGSEEISYTGIWHYDLILADLTNNPQMSGRELAIAIVTAYSKNQFSDTTFSAIDLSRIDDVASSVSKFAQTLKSGLALYGNQIRNARTGSDHYFDGYSYYIDLEDFANRIWQDPSISADIRNASIQVVYAINNAVISNWHQVIHTGSHGLSIYFDTSASSYSYNSQDYRGVDFVTQTGWNSFLEAYIGSG